MDPAPPAVFFWNVIAPSWNNRIDRADISVTFPGAIGSAQCSVGLGIVTPRTAAGRYVPFAVGSPKLFPASTSNSRVGPH